MPLPLSTNCVPFGSVPVSAKLGAGAPLALTATLPDWPILNVAAFALVNAGAVPMSSDNPLLAAGLLFASPGKYALIVCVPGVSALVEQAACELLTAAVHNKVPPVQPALTAVASAQKLTLPLGLTALAKVKVNVTLAPAALGLLEVAKVSVGDAVVIWIRRSCCGASAHQPVLESVYPVRVARTPHRPGLSATSIPAYMSTLQISGVQESYVPLLPLLALARSVTLAAAGSDAGGAKFSDRPVSALIGAFELG